MPDKNLKTLICDTFFGATGSALSQNQFQHTVIKRDVRFNRQRSAFAAMGGGIAVKPAFFMPFESGVDIVTKIASIPLAPAAFSVEALTNAGAALCYALIASLRFCIFDLNGAQNDFLKSGTYLLSSVQALSAAILSPIINAIDLVVSAIQTIHDGFSGSDNFDNLYAEQYARANFVV
ncbi:hypothetical protein [uncultured Legionella sp.]|uniref:hypothetical protein n=1 Tax=uncultured Legionella sp. TaxID=210934 RepID=UPI0026300EAE|nr:hypothetical protein [uncultured Legionella sp.]